ncbi:hypothetical protein GCM10008983_27130 [Lentibacillus halophilus]|uniref:Type IV pilus assembly protein PilM n=1 Tax=Lentibacillus halophilus TaxID=295065 RepID=A0ABP3JCI6_9BACI
MNILNNGRVNMVITNRVIRYAFHKNTSPNSIVTYGDVELPVGTMQNGTIADAQAFQRVIRQLVQENRWRRKKIAFCLVDDTVVIRDLSIPGTLSKDEAIGYIRTQIGHSFYLPFDNPALAIDVLRNDEETTDVRLYAYPKEKIDQFKHVFSAAGLHPIIADLTALSVYRYYVQTAETASDHTLLIHWNHDALFLTAFQHHKAVFNRHIKIAMDDEPAQETAEGMIDHYMTEINRMVDFYQYSITKGESRIEQLIVSGDFPYLSTAKRHLADRLELPIYEFPDENMSPTYVDLMGLGLKNGG